MIQNSFRKIPLSPGTGLWSGTLFAVFLSFPLSAHEVHSRFSVSRKAIVIDIEYGDGEAFSYESYEIFPPEKEGQDLPPFQTGRTDALGRISFLPDRAGEWTVRFASADGHGGTRKIPVEDPGELSGGEIQQSLSDRILRALSGAGFLLGIAGIFSLILARKKGNSGKGDL